MTASYAEILIADLNATDSDVRAGTEGGCGEFALMLHETLEALGVPSQIGLCCDGDDGREIRDKHTGELICWTHFIVKSEGRIFDIRGEVIPDHLHQEFGTDTIVYVDRAEAERYVTRLRLDLEFILDTAEKSCIDQWRVSFEQNGGCALPAPF